MMTLAPTDLRPSLRLAHWQHSVSDAFGPIRIESHSRDLRGAIMRRQSLGSVDLIICESPPLRVTRLCSGGVGDPMAQFLGLDVLCSGRALLRMGDRECILSSGDVVLHNPEESFSAEYLEPTVGAILLIPKSRYAAHAEHLMLRTNRVLSANLPGVGILSAALRSTVDSLRSGLTETQLTPLANALLELADMVFVGDDLAVANLRPEGALSRKALSLVEQRLADPALCASSLAVSLGVSTRTVHDVFRRLGLTPSRHITRRRLERAAAYLRGDGAGRVSDIAASVGFLDPAHFSRAFRQHFGTPPLAYRQGAAGHRK